MFCFLLLLFCQPWSFKQNSSSIPTSKLEKWWCLGQSELFKSFARFSSSDRTPTPNYWFTIDYCWKYAFSKPAYRSQAEVSAYEMNPKDFTCDWSWLLMCTYAENKCCIFCIFILAEIHLWLEIHLKKACSKFPDILENLGEIRWNWVKMGEIGWTPPPSPLAVHPISPPLRIEKNLVPDPPMALNHSFSFDTRG